MGDQARWFKLWCSAPADDHLQRLEPALRWAWAAFGAYTKLHGTRGTVSVSPTNAALAAELGVTVADLIVTLKTLPHMRVSEAEGDHGTVTVTWHNWTKYQEDSTQAERKRRSRAKKRGEEMRREVTALPPGDFIVPSTRNGPTTPDPTQGDYLSAVERLQAKIAAQHGDPA